MTIKEFFKDDKYKVLVFSKLCEYAGVDPEKIRLKKVNNQYQWPYDTYKWTEKSEKEFKEWFKNKAKKDKNLRMSLFGTSYISDQMFEKQYSFFDLMYGWKIIATSDLKIYIDQLKREGVIK